MPQTTTAAFGDVRLPERFWSKVVRPANEADCWEWSAGGSGGYGMYTVRVGKSTTAHRVCYEALVGAVDKALHMDHLCRNRKCVNPSHLEPVTCRENLLRGESFSAKNAAKAAK